MQGWAAVGLMAMGATLGAMPAAAVGQTTSEAVAIDTGTFTWDVDRTHSQVGFAIRHFFTPVEGSFDDYDIKLVFDPKRPESASVRVSIDPASIETGNDRRDADLRSENFFDVERYPGLTFESKAVRRLSETEFVVEGDLTIRDVTRPVELAVKVLGLREFDPPDARHGRALAGFEAEVEIDRRDFGVGAGRWAETVVLAPEVEISILLEARLR